ncbi:MAG TPA: hypothetical protein VJI13_02330 [Candidatus Norongarragalinales archaeon]|nr:hypothetical protein [Candidatus Norongarragalinales archaeon]
MRGQLFSFDFILAVSLIIFILALSLFVSESTANSINQSEQGRDMQRAADGALSQLIETPGSPSNWEQLEFTDGDVASLGLSPSRNMLDEGKVLRLFNLANSNFGNYSLMKRMLGLDLPSSNFSISISNSSNSAIYETNVPESGSASVYSFSRIALLGDSPVIVNLRVWVEK